MQTAAHLLRSLNANFISTQQDHLLVYYSAADALAGFKRAKSLGLNPAALYTPRWGNSSFTVAK